MDPAASVGQALREVELDLAEGADLIMVKPALAYLDVIAAVRQHFAGVSLAAYNVSGEYSMVKAAAARGWLNERQTVLESLTAIRRAGAEIILTYWAQDVARWLKE
jgi:porphobilinogen synthase